MDTNLYEADYFSLKDFSLQIKQDEVPFSVCFWIYLLELNSLPSTILQQVRLDSIDVAPFLVMNEDKKLNLFPLQTLHEEDPDSCAFSDVEFPMEKWVHIGCEICDNFVRLRMDGEIVGEKCLSTFSSNDPNLSRLRGLSLTGIDGDGAIQGYVHNIEILSIISSIKDHLMKDPPLKLFISSSASEIEEDCDGVWRIVGGKASCRMIFHLDVFLLDVFGHPANKEYKVYASLLYDDNVEPVKKPNDAEAPLFLFCDGIEFASSKTPCTLINGCATFKLKISQLSLKHSNRLFRIRFDIPNSGNFPFFEAFTRSIRCISRNHTQQSPARNKTAFNIQPANGSQSSRLGEECPEFQSNVLHESKSSPPPKRVRLGEETLGVALKVAPIIERHDEECSSHAWTVKQGRSENLDTTGNSPSNSENTEEKNPTIRCMSTDRNTISDVTIFKYCLGSLSERYILLNEISTFASDLELQYFAQQVSLYAGCSHHRRQIVIAKRLIERGTKAWNLISQNNHRVHWDDVAYEIEEQFMKIACCSTRSLTEQDFELLKRVAGCHELVTQENFEKMWHWLYPVAIAISGERINELWSCTSPKWIEGFIAKEDAEFSLRDPRSLQGPGSFILRFPISRSWPHPDAGSLVVTYVGHDYALHHRILSLDSIYSCGERETNAKALKDIILDEPELCRLGRIIRH